MYSSLIPGAALIVFLLIQIGAAALFYILRYHFRTFGAAGDERSVAIIRIFGIGLLIFAVTAAWFLAALFLKR